MDLYHGTCSRENWCCKKCSGCPTEHVFHSLCCTGSFNLLRFLDKAGFGLLFTNWNVALQIPHKLQFNIVHETLHTTKYLHSKRSIRYSVFQSKVSKADHTRVAQYIMIPKFIIQCFCNSNFQAVSQTINTYIKLNSHGNCLFGDSAKYRIYCTQTRKLALIWAFRDPDGKILAQTSGIYLETQYWTQSVLSDELSLMCFRIGFIY